MAPDYLFRLQFIVIANDNGLTFCNSYELKYVNSISILKTILQLPKDIYELFSAKEECVSYRLSGWTGGYLIDCITNVELIHQYPSLVRVIFCESKDSIDAARNVGIVVTSICSTDLSQCIINIEDCTLRVFRRAVLNFIERMTPNEKAIIMKIAEPSEEPFDAETFCPDVELSEGYVNLSNRMLLRSMRCDYQVSDRPAKSSYNSPCESLGVLDFFSKEIMKILPPLEQLPRIDVLFSDCSSNMRLSIERKKYSVGALTRAGYTNPCMLAQDVKSARGLTINSYDNAQEKTDFFKEKELLELLIAVHGANSFIPNIKLAINNSDVYSLLKTIGDIARSGGQRKLNGKLNEFSCKIGQLSFGWFNALSSNYKSNVKLLSNIPIEWGIHDYLPLMIRHDVSRIPTSPGFISTKLLLDTDRDILPLDVVQRVLIISSFSEKESIKGDCKKGVSVYRALSHKDLSELSSKLEIIVKDVRNKEELITTVNNSKCNIMVWDMHGDHDIKGAGSIILADEEVKSHELVEELQAPPIVILSACDTHPIDRNDDSTATTMFSCGAKTVLASALPIDSKKAAEFIARVLLRISNWLPIELANKGTTTWMTLVGGLLRRLYFSELIEQLVASNRLTKIKGFELTYQVCMLLDPLQSDWHCKATSLIASGIDSSQNEVVDFIKKEFVLPECLKYIQLGNPDSIVFVSNKMMDQLHSTAS